MPGPGHPKLFLLRNVESAEQRIGGSDEMVGFKIYKMTASSFGALHWFWFWRTPYKAGFGHQGYNHNTLSRGIRVTLRKRRGVPDKLHQDFKAQVADRQFFGISL